MGKKGNHFPGKGCVIFTRADKTNQTVKKEDFDEYNKEALKDSLTSELKEICSKNTPIQIHIERNAPRSVQIGVLRSYPCGGTHLKNANELPLTLSIKKISFKKKEGLKVSYEIK